jgi:Holliday junction resolvase-like predicted endonuclease
VDGDILVFVEVKTRRESDPIGGYAAAISPAKRRSLRAAVRGFTETNGDRYPHFRFDVIEILTPGALLSAERIFHFEGVPL